MCDQFVENSDCKDILLAIYAILYHKAYLHVCPNKPPNFLGFVRHCCLRWKT